MSIATTVHLNFRGDAREALTLYQSVFGGDISIVTYGEAGTVDDPAAAQQVIWGQVLSTDGFHVMAFDVLPDRPWNQGENAFFVSVRADNAEEVSRYWEALSDGATIVQPLGPSQWAPLYGMLRDRFGVTWVLDVAVEYPAA